MYPEAQTVANSTRQSGQGPNRYSSVLSPLLVHMNGEGGTGKTTVIQAICAGCYKQALKESLGGGARS
jgi:hypothetical protein